MTGSGGELVLGVDLATAAARLVAVDAATGAAVTGAATRLPRPASLRPGELEQRAVHAEVTRTVVRQATAALDRRWTCRVEQL